MIKLLICISLVLFTLGCRTIDSPEDLEYAILTHTTYHADFLDCKERAVISTRWLADNGYEYSFCGQETDTGKHMFVRWYKDGEQGDILQYEGKVLWCSQKQKYYRPWARRIFKNKESRE